MRTTLCLLLAAAASFPVCAGDPAEERDRLRRAEAVLKASLQAPDRGVPKEALERAECVGVFPGVKKAAFFVGGQGGSGLFTCRGESDAMGAPAFFKIGGGSVGWQFGGQETDLVLLVMNRDGMRYLLQDRFALGAEAAATAGPVGRTLKAATDAQLRAQILSWSRSRGVFVGAALEGSSLRPDDEANERTYGEGATAEAILLEHAMPPPLEAAEYLKALNAEAGRG